MSHFALLPVMFLFDSLLEARTRRWQLPGLAITGWQPWKQGQVGLISYRYLEIEKKHQGEYYGLVLMAQAGAYFPATGTELITLFIGLETMSLSFYVLVGFLREKRRSNEAALKYLLLGAFSSGILYGIAGSTYLADIAVAVAARPAFDPLTLIAILTISTGVLFKISAAPFHMWAPDTYEGAPTAVTQTSAKRLLAYSSIAHAGYLLLGLVAGNSTGLQGIAIYSAAYVFMTIGAFLVLIAVHGDEIDDLNGFARRHPAYAIPMVIFLLSLAGLPPTAGFLGKYYIFLALIGSGRYVLASLGAVYVAVSLFYYFRLVRSMFLLPATLAVPPVPTSLGLRITLGAGIYPEPFLQLAARSLLK